MTNIESYLSSALDYDELTDAERWAICAAMEGEWPEESARRGHYGSWAMDTDGRASWGNVSRYNMDGTAALRLVEKVGISVLWERLRQYRAYCWIPNGETLVARGVASTPSAAIVRAACELAKAQWPCSNA